jgi:putative DNA primase/helicase
MTNIIRSSKQNPCPVCNRTKDEDCSWYADGKTAMCKTYVDGVGHDESKWHYGGVNELGFQGKFVFKTEAEFVKPPRPQDKKEFYYPDRDGNSLVKVTRIDDGNGGKKFYQNHWDGGKWVKCNPDEVKKLIPIYRHAEVRQAIERNELIFVVEGEAVADTLWGLGISATTTIGGSGGYSTYGSYLDDLKGARLVLAPDRDANGLKYIANFEREFTAQIEGYYLAGSEGLWSKPSGGMDIGDDIRDQQLTKEQILDRIITPKKYRELTTKLESSSTEEPDGSNKPHFTTSWDGGLKWVTWEKNEEGETRRVPKTIGNHLEAIAYCESPDGTGAGILIEFRTQRGKAHRVLVPRGTLTGDGSEALRFLADRGYHFHRKQKQLLLDYLFGLGCEVVRVCTISDKTGWVNGSFLTPAKTYGDPDLRFREPEPDNTFTEIKGTLEGWRSGVAAKCAGNSRLIFSLGTVFAASLLEPAQIESGGFHLVGTTSIGKTTALYVAASVMGLKNVPNWRSTSNALEGKAAEFNHGLLPLDELNQADPQTVGASAYMLGNGQGKARMTKTLTNTKPKTWELLFLSTGEFSMTDYLKQSKITVKGGMEARMPSIPADAGKGYGAFENIHGYDTPKAFVDALETSIRQQQGTALDEYLTRLVEARQAEGFDKELRERVHSIAAKLSQQFNDTAIGRVAVRFALVQVGLELAHGYNLLPFPIKQCEWSVKLMFDTWVNNRGGAGSIEIKEACNKIELLFESNQHGDRIFEVGTTNPVVRNLLAYKVYDVLTQTVEFLVPTTVFNKEMAEGVDRSQLIAKLQELGYLKLSVEDDRNTVKRTILGKRRSFFAFREFWVEQKEDALGSDEKPTGHTGHTGQQPENRPERDTEESRTPRDSENTNGTHGTATGQSIDSVSRECPVRPVEENSTGQERDTLEPSPGAGLDSTVPCVPCVPLEKHVTQNAPEEVNRFTIGDRVRYVGQSQMYRGSLGKVINAENDLYDCDFMGAIAKGLNRNELEVI